MNNNLEESALTEIWHLHSGIIHAFRNTVIDAIRIGELLESLKYSMDHGQWELFAWGTNPPRLPFSQHTACRYIRLFNERERLKSSNVLDLTEAYKLLAAPEDILQAAAELRIAKGEENARQRAQLLSVPIPDGEYQVIIIDPPWPMQKIERDVAPNQVGFEYPTLELEDLEKLDLPAADDCHLFLWTTQKFLIPAFDLVRVWGFREICTMVWHKPGGFQPYGLPQFNCEFVVYARAGSPQFMETKDFMCCFQAPRREHSRKPDAFYDVIRRVTAGPRLDMFSRELRDGFEQFGNEIAKFTKA